MAKSHETSAIGISAQSESSASIDRHGRVLRKAIDCIARAHTQSAVIEFHSSSRAQQDISQISSCRLNGECIGISFIVNTNTSRYDSIHLNGFVNDDVSM
jgi:sugar (pentulose or hexulose) kinase